MTQELNIEQFSPKKAELVALAEECKVLTINGLDDKAGQLAVQQAKMKCVRARIEIQKTGKLMREDARKYVSAVISLEKDLIEIIEPVEKHLKQEQDKIEQEKIKQMRLADLPNRQARLAEFGIQIEDDFIMLMDDQRFNEFYFQKKADYMQEQQRIANEKLAAEQAKLKEAQDKIDADRKKIEEDERVANAKRQAEKDAQDKALKDAEIAKLAAEQAKQDAIDAERAKAKAAIEQAEADKQAIIAENKRKDDERIAKELADKKAADDKIKAEKDAQDKLEKAKKYRKFLTDNGYNDQTKNEFVMTKTEIQVHLFKKVGSFNL